MSRNEREAAVLEYLGDAAHVTPEQEAEILRLWDSAPSTGGGRGSDPRSLESILCEPRDPSRCGYGSPFVCVTRSIL